MSTPPPHRKRIKHYHRLGDAHELTFSCFQRRPLLADETRCKLLSEALDRALLKQDWRLATFVFMPEHLHLLIFPVAASAHVDKFLFALKRPFSYRVKQQLIEQKSSLLEELTIRQRPGVQTFRFWQEGPGYDRNLDSVQATLAAIDYFHMNPVQRGLCENAIDWHWSSARWFRDLKNIRDGLPTLTKLPPEFFD